MNRRTDDYEKQGVLTTVQELNTNAERGVWFLFNNAVKIATYRMMRSRDILS